MARKKGYKPISLTPSYEQQKSIVLVIMNLVNRYDCLVATTLILTNTNGSLLTNCQKYEMHSGPLFLAMCPLALT